MRFKTAERKLEGLRFPKTIFFYSIEIPICNICKTEIANNSWFYICDNKKFYHEKCFAENDFDTQHDKTFIDYRTGKLHLDRLVMAKFMNEETYNSFVMPEEVFA